jgi:hypothetical protein
VRRESRAAAWPIEASACVSFRVVSLVIMISPAHFRCINDTPLRCDCRVRRYALCMGKGVHSMCLGGAGSGDDFSHRQWHGMIGPVTSGRFSPDTALPLKALCF